MSLSEFFTLMFLLGLLYALFMWSMNTRYPCVPLVLLVFVFFATLGCLVTEPSSVVNKQLFTVWNRSIKRNKYGEHIRDYRQPNIQLSAEEYMMGVEMAKSNACHVFNFALDSDISRYRRCAHFFPELIAEYKRDFQTRVGVELS